ncbi:MAG TPA: DUF4129 domain-containing protein [Acidimicrobiales bacterium]|nr:DUF4129 domain-containing protein [Acidimicrobiales bacterium]
MRSWAEQVDPDDARRAADDILSRREYQEPQPSLVDRVLDAIGDLLGRAFDALTGGGAGSVIGTAIVALLVAVAVWLLVRAVGTPWRAARPPEAVAVVQGTTPADDPARWHAEAERLAGAGDHRGALRCRYQALVAAVVRLGVVDHVPGRTPAELRQELATHRPDLDPLLGSVTDRFERAWYGGEPVDGPAARAFADDVAALEADLARRAVPA